MRVLRFDSSTYHYRSVRPEQAILRKCSREIAETIRATVIARSGRSSVVRRAINHKRVCRLYCEETLQMRYKVPKRRVSAKLRDDRCDAVRMWVASLEEAVKAYGCPRRICLDNGPEFVSRDLDLWPYANGVCSTSPGRESLPITPLSRLSTAAAARSVSTSIGSCQCKMRRPSLTGGGSIITMTGRTPRLAT